MRYNIFTTHFRRLLYSKKGALMETKRYSPKFDKLFPAITVPTLVLVIVPVIVSCFHPISLCVTIPVFLFVLYFLISPVFGYAELREGSVFIRYGLILKKEIPYNKIRGAEITRKFYSDSMLTLKNSLEHLNIKYNTFDVTSISVKENAAFKEELDARVALSRTAEKA